LITFPSEIKIVYPVRLDVYRLWRAESIDEEGKQPIDGGYTVAHRIRPKLLCFTLNK